jgi:5'(3')-deoxyribonucleotidase
MFFELVPALERPFSPNVVVDADVVVDETVRNHSTTTTTTSTFATVHFESETRYFRQLARNRSRGSL